MSAIPPTWLASSITAQDAQRPAERRGREAVTNAAGQPAVFADRLTELIETSDRDSEVYSDAEGQGGGRGKSHDPPDEPPADSSHPVATESNQPLEEQAHIDLQA